MGSWWVKRVQGVALIPIVVREKQRIWVCQVLDGRGGENSHGEDEWYFVVSVPVVVLVADVKLRLSDRRQSAESTCRQFDATQWHQARK